MSLSGILQAWCACGAGVVGQMHEYEDIKAFEKFHPQICGRGLIDPGDQQPELTVGHQCPGCYTYVYETSSVRAAASLATHDCPYLEIPEREIHGDGTPLELPAPINEEGDENVEEPEYMVGFDQGEEA